MKRSFSGYVKEIGDTFLDISVFFLLAIIYMTFLIASKIFRLFKGF